MPEPKKPNRSSRATSPRASSTRKATTSKPRRRLVTKADEPAPQDNGDATFEEDLDQQSRPVAIGGERRPVAPGDAGAAPVGDAPGDAPGDEPGDAPRVAGAPGEEPFAPPPFAEPAPEVEEPRTELLVGLAAAVLAASVFLPWYTAFGGEVEVTGWASGTWGPMVFFAAFGAVAIVGLRRFGVAMSFPVSHALLLEGIGWFSVLALLIKRFRTPEFFNVVGFSLNVLDAGFWLALIAGVALALLASRLSKNTPIVLLPGWFRGPAGRVGAAILGVSLAAGVAFGLVNDAGSAASLVRPGTGPGTVPEFEKGLPECIEKAKFPVPRDVTPTQGYSQGDGTLCTALFESKVPLKTLASRYQKVLKQQRWQFQVVEVTAALPTARTFSLSKPECGQLQILDTGASNQSQKSAKRTVTVVLGDQACEAFAPRSPRSN